MERITSAQPPPFAPKHAAVDISDMQGMDFPIYVYKPRRGSKRLDECKETYKLPHRLIEKKRRDRINECIAQLKDLLPDHLKLTTLGHLEKAVVLELTLKHVKALSSLLEQQQQKIISLQKDLQIGDHGGDQTENSEEMFRSGFHLCAKEVLHYLSSQDGGRDLSPSHVINHLQKVAGEVLQSNPPASEAVAPPTRSSDVPAKNCVPVIQRTYQQGTGEQSGSDTDTDSGYGGEHDKPKARWSQSHGREVELKNPAAKIKEEGAEPQAKRPRSDSSEDEVATPSSSYMSFSANQPPFCLPFYLLPPTAAAAAAYLPMLEKCWYPGAMPVMYPSETLPSSMMSPRQSSPSPQQNQVDSSVLQGAPHSLKTKD